MFTYEVRRTRDGWKVRIYNNGGKLVNQHLLSRNIKPHKVQAECEKLLRQEEQLDLAYWQVMQGAV